MRELSLRRCVFGIVLATICSATSHARTWTDSSGKKIDAEFVRVFGSKVVLDWNGKPMQVPIHSLSEEDQTYIRERLAGKRKATDDQATDAPEADEPSTPTKKSSPKKSEDNPRPRVESSSPKAEADSASADESSLPTLGKFNREWTNRKGRKLVGRFINVSGVQVLIDRDGKKLKVAFDTLSDTDQKYVRRVLGENDVAHTLPAGESGDAAPKIAARETKDSSSLLPAEAESDRALSIDAEGEPNAKAQPLIGRTWTDVTGKKVHARLLTVKGANVVLAFRNKPMGVPFAQLSEGDQNYVRARMNERGQKELLASIDRPAAPQFQPAAPAPPPVFNPPPAAPSPAQSSHDEFLADMHRRNEESRQRMEQQRIEREQQRAREQQEMAARMQRDAEEHARRMSQVGMAPTPPGAMPEISMPSGPQTVEMEGYECEKCHHFMTSVPSSNKCPMCRTVFTEVVERNGTRRSTGASGGGFGIPIGGGYYVVPGPKMIVGILLAVIGGIAAFFRKLFGGEES